MTRVPNRFPTIPSSLRVALIGEAPSKNDMVAGEPFSDASGRFLASILAKVGTSRESCFLGNVCQVQPPANDIEAFVWNGPEIQEGMMQLREDLQRLKPNIVVCLGNIPLKAAKDPVRAHKLIPKMYAFKNANWRGSLFRAEDPNSPMHGLKCISTYHPAYVLRDYEAYPLLRFDLGKAVRNSQSPDLILPVRKLDTHLTAPQIVERLEAIRAERKLVALDIEGYVHSVSCISFSTNPCDAFIVPFFRKDRSPCFLLEEECQVWRAVARLLEDDHVPKVLQNSLYDRFVLHYGYGIRIRNVVEDTMLKSWELYCELPKKLAVQCSIYTNEPFYKDEVGSEDDETFYQYCCKDSAVTLEICGVLDKHVKATSRTHYQLNVELLNPLLYLELRGMRYNKELGQARYHELRKMMHVAQARLNAMTGCCLSWMSKNEILQRRVDLMRYKKDPNRIKAEYLEKGYDARVSEILNHPSPDIEHIGELEDLLEVSMNLGSPMFKDYLYKTLGLPEQYKEAHGETRTVTSDYEALLKLSKICHDEGNQHGYEVVQLAIEIQGITTRQENLESPGDRDGRMRFGFNVVGTDTGRTQCYKSPTGNGRAGQGIPNYTNPAEAPGRILGDRDLFMADEGMWMFQNDLKGADGWTVAAYAAMMGDRTMLEDYLAGLKPANILTLMLRGAQVDFQDRNALRQAQKSVDKDSWDYFAMKRVQHGASYLEGAITISRNILKDSEGKLVLKPKECEHMRQCFFTRYPGIRKWHDWVGRRLREKPELTAASGQVRKFFGRPDEILTKAVAFEPQANTTYATNLALHRLWHDPENRIDSPSGFRVEPLHQVHDALIGQFRKGDEQWAIKKLFEWFDNPLVIATHRITIPFDGAYGESWGKLDAGKIALEPSKPTDDKQFRGM